MGVLVCGADVFLVSAPRYFPEVILKDEEKVYAAMRGIRGKGKPNHPNRRAENVHAKLKRKAAFEALRDKGVLAHRHRSGRGKTIAGHLYAGGSSDGGFSDGDGDGGGEVEGLLPPPVNATLDEYAPAWRRARRQQLLQRQAARADAAAASPHARRAAALARYAARRAARRQRAGQLEANLAAQAAERLGPGAKAAARHLKCVGRTKRKRPQEWISLFNFYIIFSSRSRSRA